MFRNRTYLYAEILAEPADHVGRYAAAARDEAHLGELWLQGTEPVVERAE